MVNLSISENHYGKDNLFYLQNSLGEMLKSASCKLKTETVSQRAKLSLDCPEYYFDVIKTEIADKLAEIIAVKYKYDFFKSKLRIYGLGEQEKEILLVSLIAADLDEDKKYAYDRIKNYNELALDGVFNFRMQPLKRKWEEIISYMPDCFFEEQLKDFITFLLENKKKHIYVDNGKVFDNHYKRLKRCSLIEYQKLSLIREIILSNCGEIEVCGKIPEEDEKYIKRYYGGKIIFSTGYFG